MAKSIKTTASVLFDAVFIPSGPHIIKLSCCSGFIRFTHEAYKHCKAIAIQGEAWKLLPVDDIKQAGIVYGEIDKDINRQFINAIALHRHWERSNIDLIPV